MNFHNLTSTLYAYYLATVKLKESGSGIYKIKEDFQSSPSSYDLILQPPRHAEKIKSAGRTGFQKQLNGHKNKQWVDDSYYILGKI